MELPANSLSYKGIYKLMTGAIVPRPIAWIASLSESGIVNAAPFSAFTLLSQDPPLVLFQSGDRIKRKDTARNVLARREFVINLPNLPLLDQMHASSANIPPGQSEVETMCTGEGGWRPGEGTRKARNNAFTTPAALSRLRALGA